MPTSLLHALLGVALLGLVALVLWCEAYAYLLVVPSADAPPIALTPLDAALGYGLHALAYALGLVRLPFMLGPALGKAAWFRLVGDRAAQWWHSTPVQMLRLAGELAHLLLFPTLVLTIVGDPLPRWLAVLLVLATGAEAVRLVTQKGQMVVSAAWQLLPHRRVARVLLTKQRGVGPRLATRFEDACHYYALDDDARLRLIVAALRARSSGDAVAARRLRHFSAFQIVPDQHPLRGGHVRDVATGTVFIHRHWTSDPWLLLGLALRRTPWIFDPRELPRPFTYRTQANRAMTAFVLHRARYSPPFALYQFGHEIKAASHDLLLQALGWCRILAEPPVREDGTFSFDGRSSDGASQCGSGLWTDAATLHDLRARFAAGEVLTADTIAVRYTYPRHYVEEVLLPQFHNPSVGTAPHAPKAAAIADTVATGASQWG